MGLTTNNALAQDAELPHPESRDHGPIDDNRVTLIGKTKPIHRLSIRALDVVRNRPELHPGSRLIVGDWHQAEFPSIGKSATAFVIQDPDTNKPLSVTLDENGDEIDDRDLILREKVELRKRYGALLPLSSSD